MVGILMNDSVQVTNKKEFEELQKRMSTPNTAVNIKETIQNRINPKKVNNVVRQYFVDFIEGWKRYNYLIILQIIL